MCNINLGFRRARDEAENAKLLECLKESIWQASELVRLGQMDELRGFIVPAAA